MIPHLVPLVSSHKVQSVTATTTPGHTPATDLRARRTVTTFASSNLNSNVCWPACAAGCHTSVGTLALPALASTHTHPRLWPAATSRTSRPCLTGAALDNNLTAFYLMSHRVFTSNNKKNASVKSMLTTCFLADEPPLAKRSLVGAHAKLARPPTHIMLQSGQLVNSTTW